MLLMGEVLHQAKQSREDHIPLKLDVHKAFDCLEWPFVLATIKKAGMNGILSGFLKASFSTTSSHIILNGQPTSAFQLARSVRQGCPISPLVFILTYDNLSLMLADAEQQRTLVGVRFPSLGISNLLVMYANDTNITIKAEMRYILKIKEILEIFGAACGLRCIWEKTKAAYILGGPPPMAFWLLPWTWEENANASKLLGFPTASSLSTEQMEQQVQGKITASVDSYYST